MHEGDLVMVYGQRGTFIVVARSHVYRWVREYSWITRKPIESDMGQLVPVSKLEPTAWEDTYRLRTVRGVPDR